MLLRGLWLLFSIFVRSHCIHSPGKTKLEVLSCKFPESVLRDDSDDQRDRDIPSGDDSGDGDVRVGVSSAVGCGDNEGDELH